MTRHNMLSTKGLDKATIIKTPPATVLKDTNLYSNENLERCKETIRILILALYKCPSFSEYLLTLNDVYWKLIFTDSLLISI